MTNPFRFAVAFVVGLTAIVGLVAPAASDLAVDEQPDLKILGPETVVIGEDEYYETDGPQASTIVGLGVGEKQAWTITIENDGLVPTKYRLHGGSGNADFAVKYAKNGTNITSEVRSGSYTTAKLTPGQTTNLKLKITSHNADGSGDLFRVHVLATAAKDPRDNDMVLAFVNNL